MRLGLGLGLSNNPSAAASASAYLDGVVESTVFDLDATIADSYGGSGQTWSNLIASPADGSGQTDYDFWLGADGTEATDDPSFSTDEWQLDGGDFFQNKASTSPDLFAKAGHGLTGNSWWFAFTYNVGDLAASSRLFGDWDVTNGLAILVIAASGEVRIIQEQAGSLVANDFDTVSPATDNILIVSYDFDTDTLRFWNNSKTGNSVELVYNVGQNNSTNKWQIGAVGGSLPMVDGSKIYSFAGGNEFLDNTKAAAIIEHLETRHGRSYT